MNSNNVIQLKVTEQKEPIIDSDYFGSEKVPVTDLLSLLEILKNTKEKNGNN